MLIVYSYIPPMTIQSSMSLALPVYRNNKNQFCWPLTTIPCWKWKRWFMNVVHKIITNILFTTCNSVYFCLKKTFKSFKLESVHQFVFSSRGKHKWFFSLCKSCNDWTIDFVLSFLNEYYVPTLANNEVDTLKNIHWFICTSRPVLIEPRFDYSVLTQTYKKVTEAS